ncbi:hypothetical protein [Tuberibacillus sp. Marseille-P3662]|uniref:hypothetical protein n=1 Tax=Tuberibacillus sp. Marseille-P3662 TaxID=1965358 RepID=UPI000A1CEF60|nr:hypothetical protein [Tuberibacillus sp. Marseille-P3662]
MQNEEILSEASNRNNGVLGKTSNAFMAAFSYAILFVALMLLTGGNITTNTLGIPAITLFVVVSLAQYLVGGNTKNPRWLVVGSFIISVVTAIAMVIIV